MFTQRCGSLEDFPEFSSLVQSVDKITQDKFYICFRMSSHLPTAEIKDKMNLCHMAKFFLDCPG